MPAKPFLCHVGDHLGVMPDNFCQVSEERMTAFAAHVGVEDLDHAFDLEAEATDGDADAKQPTNPSPCHKPTDPSSQVNPLQAAASTSAYCTP